MIAVIFEALPRPDRKAAYFAAAESLRPLLEDIDGFISIERFESLTNPGKLLSLSFWRDEESVRQWRNLEEHRRVQGAGRAAIFADYRRGGRSDPGLWEEGTRPGARRFPPGPRLLKTAVYRAPPMLADSVQIGQLDLAILKE